MHVLPLSPSSISCSLTSWESPAVEYTDLAISLDSVLVNNPNSTYLAYGSGDSMQGVGIFDGAVVAANRLAKEAGVKKFAPFFKQKALVEQQGVTVFSSNYALYADRFLI